MLMVQWVEFILLCFVRVTTPLVVALGRECVEELLLKNQILAISRVAVSVNKFINHRHFVAGPLKPLLRSNSARL